jgi:hypothetical protein
MATTFAGNLKLAVTGNLSSDIDIGTKSHLMNYTQSYTITNGTAADQANMVFTDTRTLTASSTEDLDLAGVLTDAFGATITFTAIKGIIVTAAAANTNNVVVGGGTAGLINWVSSVTDEVIVRPGGMMAVYANDATAYPVTATTADILKVANSSSGTSVTYDIILIGTV